ncbi:hypothetical protein BJY52DRAFT_1269749 [Lactarius psammicola]|nr:hypothetical protein BJY52DRAFT_1269749 [Lactarius psammicola]
MSSSCPSLINPNADLAGIGTRINFYATILLISLIPENKITTELLDGLYENAVFYGLALVLTAVIQTLQHQLDLYHAIFVMQIIFSLDFVYAYGMRRFFHHSRNPLRATLVVAVQMFSTAVFTVWLLCVWAQNSHFGSQPDCNHLVKYVFFFASVHATATWLRTFFIVGMVFAACSLLFKFSTIVFVKPEQLEQPSGYVPDARPNGTRGKSIYKYFTAGSAVYGVTTLELIVQRNRANIGSGEGEWGFGQIVSIILILQCVVDVVVAIREWWKGSPCKDVEGYPGGVAQ